MRTKFTTIKYHRKATKLFDKNLVIFSNFLIMFNLEKHSFITGNQDVLKIYFFNSFVQSKRKYSSIT